MSHTKLGVKRYQDDHLIPELTTAITQAGRIPVSEDDVELLWAQFLGLANREIRTDRSDLVFTSGTTLDPNTLGKYCAITLTPATDPTTINLTPSVFGDEFHLEVNHNGQEVTLGTGISATSIASIAHLLDVATDFTLYTFLTTSSDGTYDDWVLVAAKDFIK